MIKVIERLETRILVERNVRDMQFLRFVNRPIAASREVSEIYFCGRLLHVWTSKPKDIKEYV